MEGDGSFYIRFRTIAGNTPNISTNMKLHIASTHAQTGGSIEPIMSIIADFFGVTLHLTKDSTYRIDVTSRAGFESVINYFTMCPLFGYKYFNYMACVKVHYLLVNKAHFTQEGQTTILNIMNELKNIDNFEWTHLDNL